MRKEMRIAVVATLLIGSFALLYREVIFWLVDDWSPNDDFSHGWVIPPLALYFAWQRRRELAAADVRPSATGLILVALSGMALAAGTLGAETFVTRVSIPTTVAGAVLFLFGWTHLRILAFPIAVLLLMIPVPSIIYNRITFPLQILASQFGQSIVSAAGIPVFREGNVMMLANTTLEVAEACSGIRSLVSLIVVGVIYGYFTDPRGGMRAALIIAAVPIAIVTNGMRVAGTGIAAYHFGPEAAESFFHTFSSWLVFLTAFALLVAVKLALAKLVPSKPRGRLAPATVT